jgi:hypothetical protein
MMFVPHMGHTYGSPRPVTGYIYFLYEDDVRISQETHLLPSTACYGDSSTFYIMMITVPYKKHT